MLKNQALQAEARLADQELMGSQEDEMLPNNGATYGRGDQGLQQIDSNRNFENQTE